MRRIAISVIVSTFTSNKILSCCGYAPMPLATSFHRNRMDNPAYTLTRASHTRRGILQSELSSIPLEDHMIGGQTRRRDEPLPSQRDKEIYDVHRGVSSTMVRGSPTLGGITLCKGWTQEASEAFIRAVESVATENPILTGHVYDHLNQLKIKSNTYQVGQHNFVRILESPENVPDNLSEMSHAEIQNYLSKNILPLMEEDELVSDQIRRKSPLFGGALMVLNEDYAVFSVKMSHAVGDGATFFQLMKQISLRMSCLPVPPIIWDSPLKAKYEFYPPDMTKSDVFKYYGPPFYLGAAKNILTQSHEPNLLLIDKKRVSSARKRVRHSLNNSDISSNDIITAALCQSNPNADVFVFTENVRGSTGIVTNAGGNFLHEVPVPREACCRPDELRKIIASHKSGYEPNKLPLLPFLTGRHARVSSLASVTENVLFKGVETVAVVPFHEFLSKIPVDVALVFRFNRDCWGIIHNFSKVEMSELLQDIVMQ